MIFLLHPLPEHGYEDKVPHICDSLSISELESFCSIEFSHENCKKTCSMFNKLRSSTPTSELDMPLRGILN